MYGPIAVLIYLQLLGHSFHALVHPDLPLQIRPALRSGKNIKSGYDKISRPTGQPPGAAGSIYQNSQTPLQLLVLLGSSSNGDIDAGEWSGAADVQAARHCIALS